VNMPLPRTRKFAGQAAAPGLVLGRIVEFANGAPRRTSASTNSPGALTDAIGAAVRQLEEHHVAPYAFVDRATLLRVARDDLFDDVLVRV